MLVLLPPGGSEHSFRSPQFSEPAQSLTLPPPPQNPPDEMLMIAEMAKYGSEVVGPPGPPLKG